MQLGKKRTCLEFFLSVRALLRTLVELTLVLCKAPAFVSFFFFLKKVEDAL